MFFINAGYFNNIDRMYGSDFLISFSERISKVLSDGLIEDEELYSALKKLSEVLLKLPTLSDIVKRSLNYEASKHHFLMEFLRLMSPILSDDEYSFCAHLIMRCRVSVEVKRIVIWVPRLVGSEDINVDPNIVAELQAWRNFGDVSNSFKFHTCKLTHVIDILRSCKEFYRPYVEEKGLGDHDPLRFKKVMIAVDTFNIYLKALFGEKDIYDKSSERDREALIYTTRDGFETCILFYKTLCLYCFYNSKGSIIESGVPWYNRKFIQDDQIETALRDTYRNIDTIEDFYLDLAKKHYPEFLTHFYPCLPGRYECPRNTSKLIWKSMYIRDFTTCNYQIWSSSAAPDVTDIEIGVDNMVIE